LKATIRTLNKRNAELTSRIGQAEASEVDLRRVIEEQRAELERAAAFAGADQTSEASTQMIEAELSDLRAANRRMEAERAKATRQIEKLQRLNDDYSGEISELRARLGGASTPRNSRDMKGKMAARQANSVARTRHLEDETPSGLRPDEQLRALRVIGQMWLTNNPASV
jgi:chromosome segregation ATPase